MGPEECLERLRQVFFCPHFFGLKSLGTFRLDPNILTLHAKLIAALSGKPDRRPTSPLRSSQQTFRATDVLSTIAAWTTKE